MESNFALRRLGTALGVFLATAVASAQSPLASRDVPFAQLDSGWVANTRKSADVVAAFHVISEGADWIRLGFGELELAGDPSIGNASTLKITSLKDGYFQILNPVSARQWGNTSAYFNGDTLLVELIAHPGTGANRVSVVKATVGEMPGETPVEGGVQKSICGLDDRVRSNDPFNARLLPIGCTAWLLDDVCGCLGTAGHCASLGTVVQFNVPLSNANGSLNNPPPQDQYTVDTSSRQFVNVGVGDDWAYFGVFPNSTTGLKPRQAQGGTYSLAPAAPPFSSSDTIRITGYGVDSYGIDSGALNQVQQTDSGPWVSASGTTLSYQVDTQGGNSGSPVFHEDTGQVIGIHTHAGCTSSGGANQGTSRDNAGWGNALANPMGVCDATCPATSVSFFNGGGQNPACLMTTASPVIGSTWQVAVDTSAVPGATFSALQVYTMSSSGTFGPGGELLVNTESTFLAASILPASGGLDVHSISVPNNLALAGITMVVQGGVGSGAGIGQLCNAEVIILGCSTN